MDVEAATLARRLLRTMDSGVLSTHSQSVAGYPFGSIVPYVLQPDGSLIIYISRIAEHTRNIGADPRVSLTVAEPSQDAQAAGRVTVLGDAGEADRSGDAAERYFEFFEAARGYDGVHDFRFVVIRPVRVRYIGGFGKIHWIEAEDWGDVEPEWLGGESRIIDHMNEDHGDALVTYCAHYGGETTERARMISLDPDGFHVRSDARIHYFPFASPCPTSEAVRKEMVRLLRSARDGA